MGIETVSRLSSEIEKDFNKLRYETILYTNGFLVVVGILLLSGVPWFSDPSWAVISAFGLFLLAALIRHLWTGSGYLLNRTDGKPNTQVTGDMLFPLFTGAASPEQSRTVLARLEQADFWTDRGMMTLPRSDPAWDPALAFGLLGGSWPNLTLWYAAAVAFYEPDRALAALEMVSRPVVEPQPPEVNVNFTEFSEWFRGDNGVNGGMHLSPWVAPTYLWAVLEGLLGLVWKAGKPEFHPHWPAGWDEVEIFNLPCASGPVDIRLTR